MTNWRWISPAVLYAVHDAQLAQHGGMDGLRDRNMVESALNRPQQQATYADPPPDAADLAAAYAYGLVRNHGFSDGNKRTAWIAARLFLLDNGLTLVYRQADAIDAVLALAAGTMSEAGFAHWLRVRLT